MASNSRSSPTASRIDPSSPEITTGRRSSRPPRVYQRLSESGRETLQASLIVDELKKQGVTHMVGVPDNGARTLFESLWADRGITVIGVTREGEAYAVASGLYVGGSLPVVIIQNTGFLETGDAFRGTAYNMGLPIVMLMGYRGFQTMEPGAERVDTA
ncbi:MAG TPA: hypothetical protein EYQ31_00555, partial [Candidatus Handelsmanbacteria bacterium]|nr:hypothetical protein [Candidatus Handelsmanbacteria bacterium]